MQVKGSGTTKTKKTDKYSSGYYDDPSSYKGIVDEKGITDDPSSYKGSPTGGKEKEPYYSSLPKKEPTVNNTPVTVPQQEYTVPSFEEYMSAISVPEGDYSAYDRAMARLEEAREEQLNAQRAINAQNVARLRAGRSGIEEDAESAARQAYISKMMNQRDLEQRLSASGYSGGMTDSAYLNLLSNYENSRNAIQRDKFNALNELELQIALAESNGTNALNTINSGWYERMADIDLQRASAEQAYRQKAIEEYYESLQPTMTAGQVMDALANGYNGSGLLKQAAALGLIDETAAAPQTEVEQFSSSKAFREASAMANPLKALSAMREAGNITEQQYRDLTFALNNPNK